MKPLFAILATLLFAAVLPAADQLSFVDETLTPEIAVDNPPIPQPVPDLAPVDEPVAEGGGPGFLPASTVGLELQIDAIERRLSAVENRVTEVEKQLRALITVKTASGVAEHHEVEIDTVAGYGDFEVPKGGRVTHVNGVPVSRVTGTTYSTSSYTVSAVQPQSRTVRFSPRGWLGRSRSTCTVDPVTGVRTCR